MGIICIIAAEKILIRSGDTDKAKIVKNKIFEIFTRKLSYFLKHTGIIDVDFIYRNNKIFILDINCRIGRLSFYSFMVTIILIRFCH